MQDPSETSGETSGAKISRFELAPPRRFILPAILLLLAERPGYGYGLVPLLQELRLGHVDRPAVYRALAQLEHDHLVEASSQSPTARQARRVYRVTPYGERVLREWMSVIKEEHDHLGHVLRRYQSSGTTDAVLAEVEGGWAALGIGWSPVSPTSTGRRPAVPLDPDIGQDGAGADPGAEVGAAVCGLPAGVGALKPHVAGGEASQLKHFHLVPDRSVVLIEVRSTVGPLSFGAVGVTGEVKAAVVDGVLRTDIPPSGRIEIDVSGLSSGNRLYDAELLRRISARRFPTATVDLLECVPTGLGSRYRLKGELTFCGVTRPTQGTASVEAAPDGRVIITGEQVFDIRDFAIPSPTVLMLRIYPDVRVRLHAEAESEET
jgi:DNA-binding PadR family transcriptional regulator